MLPVLRNRMLNAPMRCKVPITATSTCGFAGLSEFVRTHPLRYNSNRRAVIRLFATASVFHRIDKNNKATTGGSNIRETSRPANVAGNGISAFGASNNAATAATTTNILDSIKSTIKVETSPEDVRRHEEERTARDKRMMRSIKYSFYGLSAFGIMGLFYALTEWGQPKKDESGNVIRDAYSDLPAILQYARRAWAEFTHYEQMIKEPSRTKLLPEPLQDPYYQPPYTLVLEMTGVLMHPDWTYSTGWRFKKRPMIQFMLAQLMQPRPLFEIVIYTHEQGLTGFPLIDNLDPHGMIMYRLFRDATRYVQGKHVKDLNCLNRPLERIIFVDCDADAVLPENKRNAIILPRWTGDEGDRSLTDLAEFLRMIAVSDVEDVRVVLDNYREEAGGDDAKILNVFGARREMLRQQQESEAEQRRARDELLKKRAFKAPGGFGFFGRA